MDLILARFIKAPGAIYVSGPLIFLSGIFFLLTTFAVLMVMDMAECGLHTLRLHWVEFQNKFFKGNGMKWIPLTFKGREPMEVTPTDD